MPSDELLGEIAYDAYCKDAGGKSLVSGDPLPEFKRLPKAIQHAWIEAAVAVRDLWVRAALA